MRISDWSSDVCSSDLSACSRHTPGSVILTACVASSIVRMPPISACCSTGYPRSTPILARSEEHTSELQSLMRISYAVFCLKKQKKQTPQHKDSTMNQQIAHTHTKTEHSKPTSQQYTVTEKH